MKKVVYSIMPVLIFVFGLILFNVNVNAAYLKNVPQVLIQPNGDHLNCFATGDEYFNWLHDADGFTIMQNVNTGWYVYADMKNDIFIPTDLIPGKSNPATSGLKPWLVYSEKKLRSFRTKFQIPRAYNKINKKNDKLQSSENSGVLNNLVIFIRFADENGFSQNAEYFDTPYNNKNGISVYDYYYEASYKQLEIKTSFEPKPKDQTVVSYKDNHPRSYYRVYNPVTCPDGYKNDDEYTQREMTLLKNAVEYVTPDIPKDLNFDMNGDGLMDNVAFVVTGSPDGWADLIWPHMWSLFLYDVKINNLRVWNYNFLMADWFDSSVLCHEMGHTLGAPDLYRYYIGGDPVSFWDIMSNNLNPPQYSSSYMRFKYFKWISNIPEITESGWYELNPLQQKYGNSFIIHSRKATSEYYVIEYRKREGKYENSLPSSGMLVWRINPDLSGNADGPPDEIYVYREDGTTDSWGNIYNATFSSDNGRTKINNKSSNPKPFLTDGSLGGLNISDIGSNGETIRFRVNFPPKSPILNSPSNNEPASDTSPLFVWENTKDGNYYSFQLATDKNFTNIIHKKDSIWDTKYKYPFQLQNNKTYYWRVKAYSIYEEESEWSEPFILTVTPEAPIIVNQSKSEIICKDGSFFLFVSAVGTTVQYQWLKDGKIIPGATQEILSKELAGFDQSAVYSCRLTNFPGKDIVISSDMAIYVVTKSGFVQQPISQYSQLGASVNFTFKVHINGKEDNYYTDIKWYKNNKLLTDNQRIAGSKSDILNLMNLQTDDFNADYKVEVAGRCGIVITSDKFTILEVPPYKENIYKDTVCAGVEDIIETNYTGTVPQGYTLKYSWYSPFENVSNIIDSKLKVKYEGYSETPKDIICSIYLMPGSYLTAKYIYQIVVHDKPALIVDLPLKMNLNVGDIFSMSPITNQIPSKIEWYKNEVRLPELDNVGSYTINYAEVDLSGNWKLRYYNDCGETWTQTCVVTVIPKGAVDVRELNTTNSVQVFPNPTNGLLNLNLSENVEKINSIDIIDNLGNISARIDNYNLNGNIINIDLAFLGLNNGNYSVIIRSNTNIFVGKFIYLK